METSLVLLAVVGYAMVQSLAFFLLFLTQTSIPQPIRWILSGLSLCCGLIFVEEFIGLTYGYERFAHAILATGPVWYLFGPLLYLYLRAQFRKRGVRWIDLLHLTPFLFVVFTSLDFYSLPAEAKWQYYLAFRSGEFTAPVHNVNYILFFLQGLGYLSASLYLIKREHSLSEVKVWQWIWLGGLLCVSFLGFFAVLSANSSSGKLVYWSAKFFLWWLTGFHIFLFIGSFRHPRQLYYRFRTREIPADDYSHTMQAVVGHFEAEQPYLDPDYNIHQLAGTLGFSKHHLELAIKQSTDLSFRDFLNRYRIEEAKRRLQLPENRHYTIRSIAEEVGFRSQATFYRVFKKLEGRTPSSLLKAVDH